MLSLIVTAIKVALLGSSLHHDVKKQTLQYQRSKRTGKVSLFGKTKFNNI